MEDSVKSISKDDLKSCTNLYIKVFNSEPWIENWSYEVAQERLEDLFHTPKFLGYTLYSDNHLVGFIAGNQKKTPRGAVFYIAEFCIDSEIQGKGYGSKLLESLEDELINRNVSSVYLLTSNEGLAERFYMKKKYSVNENRIVMKKNLC
ncbi:GNAT family N-acetyltransferase [Salibacterium salarium]|uniref:GNAT family N-acetyltransferase n=1 Tax=Salibacterium salarium TaxID=284579 RepID=A0A428MWL2_9BACI|nr:GNAT family N-acetyltransferase [Salibacterium salarium]RSL30550.1 GNAT family N-acetyltransferase [Salibacterium salarium]